MFLVVFFNIILYKVYSHSWLFCIDYDKTVSLNTGTISNRFCREYPRGIPNNTIFGEDKGYNYQPISNIACSTRFNGKNIIKMEKGKNYRFLWPAKNHVAAPCTNPYVRDVSLNLYLYPVTSLTSQDPYFSSWVKNTYLFYNFKSNGKGFQNCPDFCPSTDRVPCFGDVPIPTNYKSGYYKGIWVWNFNPNEFFTHCMDIQITPPSNPSTISPTKSPSITPTKSPTKTPTKRPT